MTRGKLKEDLLHHVRSVMARGNLEARAEWNGGKGVIKAGIPGTESWAFTVGVAIEGDTVAVLGILRGEEDEVRNGLPWDGRKRRAVPERSFRQGPGNEREKQRFTRALKDEVEAYERRAEASDTSDAVDSLATEFGDLIRRDPDSAGEAIAALLGAQLDRETLEAFLETVAEANRDAPQP